MSLPRGGPAGGVAEFGAGCGACCALAAAAISVAPAPAAAPMALPMNCRRSMEFESLLLPMMSSACVPDMASPGLLVAAKTLAAGTNQCRRIACCQRVACRSMRYFDNRSLGPGANNGAHAGEDHHLVARVDQPELH